MTKCIFLREAIVFLTILTLNTPVFSQKNELRTSDLAGQMNVITSGVPFLGIAPESRGGAMGEAAVATSPDASSMHWNPSKYAFIETDMGVAISYTPWLRQLVDDINLSYVNFYKRIDDQQAFAASLRYFSLGNITFTDFGGERIRDFEPKEFAVDIAYALKLNDKTSFGGGLRYIYSNLTGGISAGGSNTHAGHSVAGDISMFYTNDELTVAEKNSTLNFGVHISNIGAKISYTDDSEKNFIPTNLRLGTAFTMDLDDYNSVTFAADLNKLLIPTPPVYNGQNDSISFGYDNDISPVKGIFQSFYDAPGEFEEELHEIMYSVGIEYWYAKQFAIRSGYFHEHETKGNRKYFTFGVGLRLNVFGIDFSYLIPVSQQNPLQNTMRFSLLFNFDDLKKKNEEDILDLE